MIDIVYINRIDNMVLKMQACKIDILCLIFNVLSTNHFQ